MSVERMKDTAIEALVEASIELHGFDAEQSDTNTLSALGNLVSKVVRRHVLLRELEAADWVLPTVSDRLRMGGSNNVTKAIAQLGLDAELKAARRAGKARQGRRHTEAR